MNLGLKECNKYFMIERDNTSVRHISFNEFRIKPLNDMKDYEKRYLDTYGDNEKMRRKLYVMYYSSLTNFRPSQAIKIYTMAKSKIVLDPCAGWGGRCFGAMIYGCDYIGFDTNTNLQSCYEGLVKEYNTLNKKIELHYEDSSLVDYSKYIYDTVLTSPPYYTRETYNNMPEYKSQKDFNERFLKPMIQNSYKHLQPKGVFCVNLPHKYYENMVEFIGKECDMKVEYSKTKRNTTEYFEYIYCWIKRT